MPLPFWTTAMVPLLFDGGARILAAVRRTGVGAVDAGRRMPAGAVSVIVPLLFSVDRSAREVHSKVVSLSGLVFVMVRHC